MARRVAPPRGGGTTTAANPTNDVDPVAAAPPRLIGRARAWALVLCMGLAWGLTFSLAKIVAGAGAHPFGITFWQALLGAAVLLAFNAKRRRRISAKPEFIRLYLICGLLGMVIPGILFFYAASRVSAGVLSITIIVVPLLTFLLSAFAGLERFALGRVTGVVCGAVAVVLLVAPEASLPDPSVAPWVLVACAAAACYAVENMVIALRMPEGADPFMVACGMFLMASAILGPLVVATGSFVPLGWPWGPVEWSIVAMAAIGAVAYSLFIYLIDAAGPVFASQTAYVVTLSGVAWGIALFGEQHSAWIWLALIVMLAGLALVTPRKRPHGGGPGHT